MAAAVALLTLYICVRVAVMRAVATLEGLILYGPLWTAIVRWERVATVVHDGADRTCWRCGAARPDWRA